MVLAKFERTRIIFESALFWLLVALFVSLLFAPFVAGLRGGAAAGFRAACGAGGEVDSREMADVVLGGGAEGVGLNVRWRVVFAVALDSACSPSLSRCEECC